MIFRNRRDAGRYLASKLARYADSLNVIVLALPRGGVPVAFEVAQALHAPLDVFSVRKLGVPGHEELAMGAIASWGTCVLNDDVVRALRIPSRVIDNVAAQERRELDRRERKYRAGRPAPQVRDQVIILVDDGLATGSTMRAAIAAPGRAAPRGLSSRCQLVHRKRVPSFNKRPTKQFAQYPRNRFTPLAHGTKTSHKRQMRKSKFYWTKQLQHLSPPRKMEQQLNC